MKYKITIEYEGTCFIGWQRQVAGLSVQESIEGAIYKFSQEQVTLYGSSRTDAGVHALGQVAHFSIKKAFTCYQVQNAINYHLKPLPVVIIKVEVVDDDFCARFLAIKRHYQYRIINRRAPLVIDQFRAWVAFRALDVKKMQLAGNYLLGKHNFNSFRSTECQAKSPIRTIDKLEIVHNDTAIDIYISAPSFLHNKVRIIVGTLKEIGEGKQVDIKKILADQDRRSAGVTAPPYGLYLLKVDY